MLTGDQIRAAADLLWQHWQDDRRMSALPAHCRPETRAEGYAVQAVLEQRSAAPLFGWKIAATSEAGQTHIGVDGPLAGRLLAERAFDDGAVLEFGANHMAVAEPEFAFRLGRDLSPRDARYGVEEVMAAVESLHPAIEIPDSRYEDFATVGGPQLIADNACAHEFVLGPAADPSWRATDLVRHQVRVSVTNKAAHEGSGVNVLGDPRVALTWAANELSALGISLKAGQVVTTGTSTMPLPVGPGDEVVADFGNLGRVRLRFRAA